MSLLVRIAIHPVKPVFVGETLCCTILVIIELDIDGPAAASFDLNIPEDFRIFDFSLS